MRRGELLAQHYYSNGAYGRAWGVRLITGLETDPASGLVTVSFKGMAGHCRRKSGTCSAEAFSAWAKYEVALNENSWQRVSPPDTAGSE
jgi:hypothetical protein